MRIKLKALCTDLVNLGESLKRSFKRILKRWLLRMKYSEHIAECSNATYTYVYGLPNKNNTTLSLKFYTYNNSRTRFSVLLIILEKSDDLWLISVEGKIRKIFQFKTKGTKVIEDVTTKFANKIIKWNVSYIAYKWWTTHFKRKSKLIFKLQTF